MRWHRIIGHDSGGSILRAAWYTACLGLALALAGCGSIAKGVTEAILEQAETEDTRACHITGPASTGLATLLETQEQRRAGGQSKPTLKILMVHGIGRHLPGYSARLTEHLMRALELNVISERAKEIVLQSPAYPDQQLGQLRINRFTNKARTRELLFYELTWSEIIEAEKKPIAFDDSSEYTFRRTALNSFMKEFFNSHVSDPLIYLGRSHTKILTSVREAFCWMTQGDWDDYEDFTSEPCDIYSQTRAKQVLEDDIVVVTHSLGSRMIIDMAQSVAALIARDQRPELDGIRQLFRTKELRVYMLANQLPLLELGREPAEVRGEIAAYCTPDGEKFDQRMIGNLAIFAFSDPNDLLSYAIPPKFVDDYMDSRICPRITNIILNVAQPLSLLGLGEFANPLDAHTAYDYDDRVIGVIAHGIGQDASAQIVKDRCTWLETES